MRPRNLEEYVGQEHILGTGRLLRRAILADQLSSLIFYGPPGTGKTTLARVITQHTQGCFLSLNAVLAGIKDLRDAISEAERNRSVLDKKTILFIDEVHRFNKSQQDALLPHVENGIIILIGATTENPYFEVNKALVSRSRIFELKPLSEGHLSKILEDALNNKERGYGNYQVRMLDEAKRHLLTISNGDARSLLNAIELAVEPELKEGKNEDEIVINLTTAEESIQKKAVLYDKGGDAHYDVISAFIKSIRGSDPDAALYWLAKMLVAGEDPRFIFRRMLISASEDIGLAASEVLTQVVSASQAFDYVGMPEGRFHLTQACLILCNAPKSNSTMGVFDALKSVLHEENDDVPNHLKDNSRDGEDLGHGKGYKYPHAFEDHWVEQQYLPDGLKGRVFYHPSNQGNEKHVVELLEKRRQATFAYFSEEEWNRTHISNQQHSEGHWLDRTLNDVGEQIQHICESVLEVAQIKRDHLILDLHAESGCLTFEAAQQAKVGGVYALAWNQGEKELLDNLKLKLTEIERPEVILCPPEKIKSKFPKDAGYHFDKILIRNFFSKGYDFCEYLPLLRSLLSNQGEIIWFEFLHSQGQRLSEYFSLYAKNNELVNEFKKLEDEYFNIEYQEDEARLLDELQVKKVEYNTFTLKKKFSSKEINTWFDEKSPLGLFFNNKLSSQKLDELKHTSINLLANKVLNWKKKYFIVKL